MFRVKDKKRLFKCPLRSHNSLGRFHIFDPFLTHAYHASLWIKMKFLGIILCKNLNSGGERDENAKEATQRSVAKSLATPTIALQKIQPKEKLATFILSK